MPKFAPSFIAALCWGAMFSVAASALHHTDAVHLTAMRYLGASAIFLVILAATEGRRSLRLDGHGTRVFLLGTAGFAGFNLLGFAALGHTSPEHAALIVATAPIVTLLGRWITDGARPSRGQLACVVAAFLGVGLVITKGHPSALTDGGIGLGEAMVLAGVIAWVGYTLGSAHLAHWSPLRFTALTATAGTASVLAIAVVGDASGLLAPPSAGDVRAILPQLAYMIVLGAVVAVLCWNTGVRALGAANAALFMNLVPVTAFVVEAARGAAPTVVEVAGAAITLGALVTANLLGRRAAAHDVAKPRHDRLDEVVRLRRGGQRIEMAGARAAIDER